MTVPSEFSDTKNELTREVGGYEHVVVLQDTKVVDGDLVEALQQLPRGTFNGDCILYFFKILFFAGVSIYYNQSFLVGKYCLL